MKLKILIYGFFFMIFAASCNKSDIETDSSTLTTANLKAATVGTIFVSTKGSDSYSGTETSPFLTLAKAASVANPGDIVIVEDGTYTVGAGGIFAGFSRSGSSSAYITYKARNIGKAILDGKSNSAQFGFSVTGSYINIEGFEIKGLSDVALIVSAGATKINFRDLNIHDIGRKCTDSDTGFGASYFNKSSYITVERCLIHDIGRYSPGENGCSTTNSNYMDHDHGVYCDGVTNITIQNNVFYNVGRGFALQVYSGAGNTSSNVTFVNNTCENGNQYHYAGHIILWGNISNALIANNIFKDHLDAAIQIYQGSYTYSTVLITKNITSGGSGIINTGTASGVTLTGNYNSTDPMFTDEANHIYTLKSGSPAAIAGYATGITTDFCNSVRAITNIGAYSSTSTSVVPSSTYYNSLASAAATKNSCGTGFTGSVVTYSVPASKYSSAISQADADAQATADLTANKQAYANTNGTCTNSSTTFSSVQTVGTATKNDCGSGYSGSVVTYTIMAGAYTSTISQADANNQATSDLNNNIQAWANSHGTCTASSVVYTSVQTVGSATKNDCGSGYTGSVVPYTIMAGAYTSTISQADANNQAISDMNNNMQAWANSHGTCTANAVIKYYNVASSATATKNSCGTGYTGSTVTYTVAANKYSSTVSQSAANSLALADLTANKQAYANANGTCTKTRRW